MRNGCENISAMCCRTFYAVSVIDSSLSGFMVDIKILQIVVKINGTGTEIAAEERCVGCEHSGDVDMSLTAKGDGDTCLPFMEVCNNSCCQLTGNVLRIKISLSALRQGIRWKRTSPRNHATR